MSKKKISKRDLYGWSEGQQRSELRKHGQDSPDSREPERVNLLFRILNKMRGKKKETKKEPVPVTKPEEKIAKKEGECIWCNPAENFHAIFITHMFSIVEDKDKNQIIVLKRHASQPNEEEMAHIQRKIGFLYLSLKKEIKNQKTDHYTALLTLEKK